MGKITKDEFDKRIEQIRNEVKGDSPMGGSRIGQIVEKLRGIQGKKK